LKLILDYVYFSIFQLQLPALVGLNEKVASLNMVRSYHGVGTAKVVSSESNPWYCFVVFLLKNK